jgi:saccharopine dehydrogenase (NAD+, L-lysine forming)
MRVLVARLGDERFGAAGLDASDAAAIAALACAENVDTIVNATDPRFNPAIFDAAFGAGSTYLDMAMTLSSPGDDKLGDAQFAQAGRWEEGSARARRHRRRARPAGRLRALRRDHLFSEIDEVGIRDGADLVVDWSLAGSTASA